MTSFRCLAHCGLHMCLGRSKIYLRSSSCDCCHQQGSTPQRGRHYSTHAPLTSLTPKTLPSIPKMFFVMMLSCCALLAAFEEFCVPWWQHLVCWLFLRLQYIWFLAKLRCRCFVTYLTCLQRGVPPRFPLTPYPRYGLDSVMSKVESQMPLCKQNLAVFCKNLHILTMMTLAQSLSLMHL